MRHLKVLVVDDEPDIREILSDILCLKECQVTGADSPHQALELLKSAHFDIVFSDMNMPGMNGIDFFRTCLPTLVAKNVKRFLLTGEMNPESLLSQQDKENHLIHGYISKPFHESQLDEALKSINKS